MRKGQQDHMYEVQAEREGLGRRLKGGLRAISMLDPMSLLSICSQRSRLHSPAEANGPPSHFNFLIVLPLAPWENGAA